MNLSLSPNIKGLCYLIGGIISLLYINGWFVANLYYPMLAGSVTATTYGFVVTDAWDWILALVKKLSSAKQNTDNSQNK